MAYLGPIPKSTYLLGGSPLLSLCVTLWALPVVRRKRWPYHLVAYGEIIVAMALLFAAQLWVLSRSSGVPL
jgi:hypothetical protein